MSSPVIHALILGVLQGLTEFLPISSSGHLALAQALIPGFDQPGVLLDVMLHAGTLAAIVIYFRRDLLDMALALRPGPGEGCGENRRLILVLIAASVPTALIGFAIEDRAEAMFESVPMVGAALIVTGAWLLVGEWAARRRTEVPGNPAWWRGVIIGIAQGIAVVPGISRSGSTISTARMLGVSGEKAARFSFLLSLPAVGGAAAITLLKHLDDIQAFTGAQALAYVVGPVAAGITGWFAILMVMRLLSSGRFAWFAAYCFAVGALSLAGGLLID